MNCKYIKIKSNKKFECKRTKIILNIKKCNDCEFKEYKLFNSKIKNRTSKLAKLERNRSSVFTDDLFLSAYLIFLRFLQQSFL